MFAAPKPQQESINANATTHVVFSLDFDGVIGNKNLVPFFSKPDPDADDDLAMVRWVNARDGQTATPFTLDDLHKLKSELAAQNATRPECNRRDMGYMLSRWADARYLRTLNPLTKEEIAATSPILIAKMAAAAQRPDVISCSAITGSNRQYKGMDDDNGLRNLSGSAYPAYRNLVHAVNEQCPGDKQYTFNPFLLPDAYHDYAPGTCMQEIEKANALVVPPANRANRELTKADTKSVNDESKITLIYAQAHELASKLSLSNRNDKIELHFVDDLYHDNVDQDFLKHNILGQLRLFYTTNPELLPANVTLVLHHFNDKPTNAGDPNWTDIVTIQGTGNLNKEYPEALHWIAGHCLDNQYGEQELRTPDQKYVRGLPFQGYRIEPLLNLKKLDVRSNETESDRAKPLDVEALKQAIIAANQSAAAKIRRQFDKALAESLPLSTELNETIKDLRNELIERLDTLNENEIEPFLNDTVKPFSAKTTGLVKVLANNTIDPAEKIIVINQYRDEIQSSHKLNPYIITAGAIVGAALGFVIGAVIGALIVGGLSLFTMGPAAILPALITGVVTGKQGALLGMAAGASLTITLATGILGGTRFGMFLTRDKVMNAKADAISQAALQCKTLEVPPVVDVSETDRLIPR